MSDGNGLPCGCDASVAWVCRDHRCEQCELRRAIVEVRHATTGALVQLCATCHAQHLAASSGT